VLPTSPARQCVDSVEVEPEPGTDESAILDQYRPTHPDSATDLGTDKPAQPSITFPYRFFGVEKISVNVPSQLLGIKVVRGLNTPSSSMLHIAFHVAHLDFVDQRRNPASQMVAIVTGKLQWKKVKVFQSTKGQLSTWLT